MWSTLFTPVTTQRGVTISHHSYVKRYVKTEETKWGITGTPLGGPRMPQTTSLDTLGLWSQKYKANHYFVSSLSFHHLASVIGAVVENTQQKRIKKPLAREP